MPTHSHVGWGLAISLLLHAMGIAALSLAIPRLNVRPGVARHVEFAVLAPPKEPERVTEHSAATTPPAAAAITQPEPSPQSAAPIANATLEVNAATVPLRAAPARKPAPKPLTVALPAQLPDADPRSDGTALERALRQIAATTELTPDERRKAMLVVLRTWQDPSGKRSAEELIDALLENARPAPPTPQP